MKITIIGAGNIGGAMAIGLCRGSAGCKPDATDIDKSATAPADITVTAAHGSTLGKFSAAGMNTSLSNSEAVKDADIIFLAVKPWAMHGVVDEIKGSITENQLIVSVAPGVKSADLQAMFGKEIKLAYVIPNTAIEVGESMTFITPITATKEDTQRLEKMFAKCGTAMVVDEKLLMAGTALASCGIAYALRYIRAATEGGVEMGFYAKDASEIAAQTVKGAAAVLSAHGSHPEAEIDKVTTPGGMTIKGLNAMEEAGFTNAVIKGLKAGKTWKEL